MQIAAASAPSPASTVVQGADIPFAEAGHVASPGNFTGLFVAAMLLTAAFVVLYILRQRGIGRIGPMGVTNGSLRVVQRLRLNASCEAFVLDNAGERLVVFESKHGLQILRTAESVEQGVGNEGSSLHG